MLTARWENIHGIGRHILFRTYRSWVLLVRGPDLSDMVTLQGLLGNHHSWNSDSVSQENTSCRDVDWQMLALVIWYVPAELSSLPSNRERKTTKANVWTTGIKLKRHCPKTSPRTGLQVQALDSIHSLCKPTQVWRWRAMKCYLSYGFASSGRYHVCKSVTQFSEMWSLGLLICHRFYKKTVSRLPKQKFLPDPLSLIFLYDRLGLQSKLDASD